MLLSWLAAVLAVAVLGLFALVNVTTLLIILMHLTAFFLLCELAGWIIRLLTKKRISYDIRGGAAILLTAVYLGVGVYMAFHVFETDYEFETEKDLKQDLRIVQIADSHLGVTLDGERFSRQMERIQAVKPDVVVVVGDFVDDDSDAEDMIRACAALGELETTYGVYFVYGNHDDGYFQHRNFTAAQLEEELRKNNVVILEDESVLLDDSFYLVGRRDRSMPGREEAGSLTAPLDNTKYIIMLDHQPNDYDAEAASGADLVLSGHTHGGHIFPGGLIGIWTGANDRAYGTELRGNTRFVVTSGISGWAIPIKTGTYSEFVVIDVHRAA